MRRTESPSFIQTGIKETASKTVRSPLKLLGSLLTLKPMIDMAKAFVEYGGKRSLSLRRGKGEYYLNTPQSSSSSIFSPKTIFGYSG